MLWYNEAPTWREEDNRIHITTAPKTDFWRKTHYGFIRDNGHYYYTPVSGDFDAAVKVSGQYRDLYDQAGLMVRIDEQNWLKCGIEYVDGVQHISAVFTRDFSDWSVTPLPQKPPCIWLRLTRRSEAIEIHYSLDGSQYTLLRLGYLLPEQNATVGVMCASPDGEGFAVCFEDFAVSKPYRT
jgi:regulation of enolase protein 1 (concanavalin A-like superfamily)